MTTYLTSHPAVRTVLVLLNLLSFMPYATEAYRLPEIIKIGFSAQKRSARLLTTKQMELIVGTQGPVSFEGVPDDQLSSRGDAERIGGRAEEAVKYYAAVLGNHTIHDVPMKTTAIDSVADMILEGEISERDLPALANSYDPASYLGAHLRELQVLLYLRQAEVALSEGRGVDAGDYIQSGKELALDTIAANPLAYVSALAARALFKFNELADDMATARAEMDAVMEVYPESFAMLEANTWASYIVWDLQRKEWPRKGDRVNAFLYNAPVEMAETFPFVEKFLNDPSIPDAHKGRLLNAIAAGAHMVGKLEKVYEYAERVFYLENPGDENLAEAMHHMQYYYMIRADLWHDDPAITDGLDISFTFVDLYPDHPYIPEIKRRIGDLYATAQDYRTAVLQYLSVADEHPGTRPAIVAESTARMILRIYPHATGSLAKLKEDLPEWKLAQVEKRKERVAEGRTLLARWKEKGRKSQEIQLAKSLDSVTGAGENLCGPIALNQVLESHDIKTTVLELARLAGTNGKGTSMLGLKEAAEAKGLKAVGLKVDTDTIEALPTPFIAHLNGDHYVVVTAVTRNRVDVHDGEKKSEVEISEFMESSAGTILIVALNTESFEAILSGDQMAKIWGALDAPDNPGCCNNDPKGCKKNGSGPMSRMLGNSASGFMPGADPSGGGSGSLGDILYYGSMGGIRPDFLGGNAVAGSCNSAHGGYFGLPSVGGLRSGKISSGPSGGVWNPNGLLMGLFQLFGRQANFIETDLSIPTRGQILALHHSRARTSTENSYFTEATPFQSGHGKGWTHNNNIHLVTKKIMGSIIIAVVMIDGSGSVRYYTPDGAGRFTYAAYSDSEYIEQDETDDSFYLYDFVSRTTLHFDAPVDNYCKILTATDDFGNTLEYDYDGSDRLISVTDDAGMYLQYEWNYNDLMTKVSSPNEELTVTYEYDVIGQLTKVVDGANNYIEYHYASNGNITQVTDKRGYSLTYDWPAEDILYVKSGATTLMTLETDYDGSWRYATATDANGYEVHYKGNWNFDVTEITFGDPQSPDAVWSYERWDGGGGLQSMTTPNNDTISWGRDSNGNYSYVTQGGLTAYFEYDDSHHLTRYVDEEGNATDYEYYFNEAGQNRSYRTDANGNEWKSFFDQYGQLERITDPLSHDTEYVYDTYGNVITTTDHLGNERTYEYDSVNRLISITELGRYTTTITYTDQACGSCGGGGTLIATIDGPLTGTGDTWSFAYDANGNLITSTDPLSRQTTYAYDSFNNLVSVYAPGGRTVSFGYDDTYRLTAVSDSEGNISTLEYSGMGFLTKATSPTPIVATIELEYDGMGNLLTLTDPLNHDTIFEYDQFNRLITKTDPLGNSETYVYDDVGKLVQMTDGESDTTHYFYDDVYRLTHITYPSPGGLVDFYYDTANRLTNIDDWLGDIYYYYDDINRLTKWKDYDGTTFEHEFDDAQVRWKLKDNDAGDVVTYKQGGDQKRIVQIYNGVSMDALNYKYDVSGAMTEVKHGNPNVRKELLSYDSVGRLETIQHKLKPDTTWETAEQFDYEYDKNDNITRVTHADGDYWDYEYDSMNRLVTATRNNSTAAISGTWDYTYDKAGNILTKVEPFVDDFEDGDLAGWSGTSGWSAANQYLERTSGTGGIRQSNSDADLALWFSYYCTDDTTGNDGYVYFRIASGEYIRLNLKPDKMVLLQKKAGQYTNLDQNSQATTEQGKWYDVYLECEGANVKVWRGESGQAMTEVLSTSSAGFLTSANLTFAMTSANAYRYDNIRVFSDDLDTTTAYAFNALNQLTSDGRWAYTYDKNGSLTQKSDGTTTFTYEYGYGNRMTKVKKDGNTIQENTYGGDGRRRLKTEGSEHTWYNWDGIRVISEEDQSSATVDGSEIAHYFHNFYHGTGSLYAMRDSGGTSWFHNDILGSTRLLSQNEAVVRNYEYEPYGSLLTSTAPTGNNYLFTGKEFEPTTGFYHFPMRYYGPSVGRWTQPDPAGMIDGPNLYGYVRNNPVNLVDILGLISEEQKQNCIDKFVDCVQNGGRVRICSACRSQCMGQQGAWPEYVFDAFGKKLFCDGSERRRATRTRGFGFRHVGSALLLLGAVALVFLPIPGARPAAAGVAAAGIAIVTVPPEDESEACPTQS